MNANQQNNIWCDGGGSQGHPRVFLIIKEGETSVKCPYCGKSYTAEAR